MKPKKKPLRIASVRTLQRLAVEGADGRHWYQGAELQLRRLCEVHDWDPTEFAEVLALTSPRVQVSRNVPLAIKFMRTGLCMRLHRAQIEHWLKTGVIRGKKCEPFARALMGDPTAVVLDVWMSKALGVTHAQVTQKRVMDVAVPRVHKVARALGWTPCQVQAAIWTAKFEEAHTMRAPGLDAWLAIY
jgi:hypothetical protein